MPLPVALAAPPLLFALSIGGFAAATIAKPGSDDSATIHGTIVDESGRPVENATVFVYSARLKKVYAIVCPTCWIDCGKHTETNAQGQFAITGSNPALKFRLLVLKAGFAATAIGGVDPAQGPVDPIELKPRATSTEEPEIVPGRITDASGSPVAGALIEPVEVFEPGGTYSIGAISWIDPLAVTDASGNFEIVASRPVKRIMLKISPRPLAAQIVTGLPGPATNSFVLTEGATVMGRLVEPNCKPIADAESVMISHTDHLEQSFGDKHVGTEPVTNRTSNAARRPRRSGSKAPICGRLATMRAAFAAPPSGQSAGTWSARHRGQRVCIAGEEPAPIGLLAVDRDSMTGQLGCYAAGTRCHR